MGSQPVTHQLPSESESRDASLTGKVQSPSIMNQKQSANTSTKPAQEEEFESADSALSFMVISLFSLLFSTAWLFLSKSLLGLDHYSLHFGFLLSLCAFCG